MLHPTWPVYMRVLLMLHITFGLTAFVCAPVALATAKGGKAHRRWGKIYFWAMAGVGATALILSLALPIFFLAMVSVFSFYACFAAYRVLSLKNLYQGAKAPWIDWMAALFTILSSFVLFSMGFLQPRLMKVGLIQVAGHTVSIVSIIFGILGMRLGFMSIAHFRKPPTTKMFWWFAHMDGMIASYIAAMTAFSAVNLTRWFGPAWWVWLWPTMLGVPAIAVWKRYYESKFAPATRQPVRIS